MMQGMTPPSVAVDKFGHTAFPLVHLVEADRAIGHPLPCDVVASANFLFFIHTQSIHNEDIYNPYSAGQD